MRDALSSLQACLYCYEATDLENVKQCLRDGTLGRSPDGKICKDINKKAQTYREHVCVWTYSKKTINDKLSVWMTTYRDEYDDCGKRLFTDFTVKTVIEQMSKTEYIVDCLSKDELYLEVKASAQSKTGLSTYIGARGSESKLEKGHHAIAHFANGGMRHTLADYLGLGGIALYNRRIRYRLKLAKLKPEERAKVPVGFQTSPHYTDHLRLSHNNNLGRVAGLQVDVHKPSDVEILQPDNGERFFYEYWLQEQERVKQGVMKDEKTNQCLCKACGFVSNPYRKRKQQWETQDDVQVVSLLTPSTPPSALPELAAMPTEILGLYSFLMKASTPTKKKNSKKKNTKKKKVKQLQWALIRWTR